MKPDPTKDKSYRLSLHRLKNTSGSNVQAGCENIVPQYRQTNCSPESEGGMKLLARLDGFVNVTPKKRKCDTEN